MHALKSRDAVLRVNVVMHFILVDKASEPPLSARSYLLFRTLFRSAVCPDGAIGRRTVFRWRRSQGRGGSSPLLGTRLLFAITRC